MSEETQNDKANDHEIEEEEAALDIQVGVENGRVFISFSQRLSMVAMPPDSARTMAKALIGHADEAEKLGG